jgi:hypothetical protein
VDRKRLTLALKTHNAMVSPSRAGIGLSSKKIVTANSVFPIGVNMMAPGDDYE